MNDIVDALRKKFRTPGEALKALGLDEGLVKGKQPRMGAVARVLRDEVKKRTGIAQDADLGDLIALLDALKKSEEANLEDIQAALGEAKEAGGEGGEEEEGGKAPPEDKREFSDEFEEETPAKPKEDKMAGTEPNAGIPAIEKTDKVKDEGMEEGVVNDDPAKELHAILSSKLDENEMRKVGEILLKLSAAGGQDEAEEGAEDSEEEDKAEDSDTECSESMSANKEDGPKVVTGGAKKPAMDAKAVQMAVDAALKAERVRQSRIRDAENVCRPYVGNTPAMSFDSEADVYRHTLTGLGVDGVDAIKDVAALKIILKSQPVPGSERRPAEKRLGMDAAASKSFFERFPGAARIGH